MGPSEFEKRWLIELAEMVRAQQEFRRCRDQAHAAADWLRRSLWREEAFRRACVADGCNEERLQADRDDALRKMNESLKFSKDVVDDDMEIIAMREPLL